MKRREVIFGQFKPVFNMKILAIFRTAEMAIAANEMTMSVKMKAIIN